MRSTLYRREEKRSACFDLMKGVCIILVVMEHCNELMNIWYNKTLWSMLEHLRMPLYFFLSGMFFKEYTCFKDFFIRKFNKILIPYIFFSFIDVLFRCSYNNLDCGLNSILRNVYGTILWGGAHLWFLRTLFVANILYYIFNKLTKKLSFFEQLIILIVVVCITYWIKNIVGEYWGVWNLYNVAIGALLVLPFFFMANLLRNYLQYIYIKKKNVVLSLMLFVCLSAFLSNDGVYLNSGKIENNIVLFYIASLSSIMSVWCICYMFKRVFYVSYVGRYSLIVYALHYRLISFLIYYIPDISIYLCFVVVLAMMPVMIWFFKRYFPAFVAQRDIFVYDNGKIKVDWNVFSLKNR